MRCFFLKRMGLLTLLLLLLAPAASAQVARDITKDATITASARTRDIQNMFDGVYDTWWRVVGAPCELEFTLPDDEPCYGVYASFARDFSDYVLEYEQQGTWIPCDMPTLRCYNQYLPLDGATHFRLRSEKCGMEISALRLLSEGDVPKDVQRWLPPCEKADLMLIVAHPDDELLWFGGLLPTYAGERKLNVQVVYLTASTSKRRNELLDGLWTCGVRNLPDILSLKDVRTYSRNPAYEVWGGRKELVAHIARVIRQYRPEVVVTQAQNGEYGHGAHQALSNACPYAVEAAAQDKKFYDKRIDEYPPWQVKKLYLHLYGDAPLTLDWNVPLDAFDGQTALEVAHLAYKKHISQQDRDFTMDDFGATDCRLMGLYFSAVGEDEARNDLMEHIDLPKGE